MRRRQVLRAALALAVAAASAALAQPRSRRAVIGFLAPQIPGFGGYRDEVAAGLKELGYREGQDYIFEERSAEGDIGRLASLAQDLVRSKPDVIVAPVTVAALAARRATSEIPIVGASLGDPVAVGLVSSEAQPGTNVTGIRSWMEAWRETGQHPARPAS